MTEDGVNSISSKLITLKIVRESAELAGYREEWDQLLENCVQKSPMLSYAWVSSYLDHRLENSESWYVVLAHSDNKLVGVLPVIVTPYRVLGLSRPVLKTPHDAHTLGGDALLARDATADLFPLIIQAAELETPDRYVFKLSRVVEDSPTITSCLILKDHYVHKENVGIGYYYPARDNFEEYYSALSKNMRGNLRRAENKLRQMVELEMDVLEGVEATAGFLNDFMPVEASGWKGRSGSAIGKSTELTDFYTTLTERLSRSGMLRWECLYGDRKLIAANLCVRFGGTIVIWKLGYDEDFRKYSPGGILFKHVLERAFSDDGIEEFNLMSDTAWQTNWNPKQRNYFDLFIYPKRPISVLFGYLPQKVKDLIRKVPIFMKFVRALKKLLKMD